MKPKPIKLTVHALVTDINIDDEENIIVDIELAGPLVGKLTYNLSEDFDYIGTRKIEAGGELGKILLKKFPKKLARLNDKLNEIRKEDFLPERKL